jgi:GWxTD domain-containing protein
MKTKIVFAVLLIACMSMAKEFFYVDYSCFKTADDSKTRTDIYISIPVIYLEFDKEMTSVFSISVSIYDKDKLIAEDRWKQKYSITGEAERFSGAEIPVMSKLELPPGYYRLVVEVEDLNTGKKIDTLEVPQESKMFMVAGFTEKFSISTIQLASRIITSEIDEKSEFFRQGVIILPNPSKVFGTTRPFLYYYTEVYGLNEGDEIEYVWSISSSESAEVKKGEAQKKTSSGKSMVLADRISVPVLKTGSYNLGITVTNRTTGRVIEGGNNFYMYRKIDFVKEKYRVPEGTTTLQKDSIEIDIMKDDEISTEYDQVFSILDKKDQNRYSGLITAGKREFLKKYWTEKESSQKNARENFKSLLQKIENEFSSKKTEGWKTDRGRIYLKLGPPNKRDIETYNNEFQDHEVWYYFSGSYTFVFADSHGLGDFKLIHSDYPGEKNDPNWQKKILKSKF